jgi:hypothetical protein
MGSAETTVTPNKEKQNDAQMTLRTESVRGLLRRKPSIAETLNVAGKKSGVEAE